jgi:hypothetical protein
MPLFILHEFVEMCLMKYKRLSYIEAHRIASKVEFKEEGKFDKPDALKLTKETALAMAQNVV